MTDPIDVAGLAAEQMPAARRFDAARQEMAAANEAVSRSQWLTAAELRRQRDAGDELRSARRALRAVEARYAAACDSAAAGLAERDDGQQELAL